MKEAIKAAFPYTIPVCLGYVPLGIAYGLMMANANYGVLWGFFSSLFIYSGTAQFVSVDFLATGTALLEIAIIIIVMNSRMMFYGLSFLERFDGMGLKKWYMIFALTDETYALLSAIKIPEQLDEKKFMLALAAMNQSYWIAGSVIGITVGNSIHFNSTGIDFAMTALFVVLCMDQWKAYKSHEPAMIGLSCSVAALIIFGAQNFMIPSLIAIIAVMVVRRKSIAGKMDEDEKQESESEPDYITEEGGEQI
ncbi:AzlC family ABC transporter permease [Clostridium aminobutyricum]|uniref:AzlC family ABC transporter permease n=1 Tax=Clostridium aminobutyricum TaxID=33953 RepID=A0A939D9X5_CLOAM|nr:AzlC family ABC transporter permease [Clostridium aminobutyricum]MBN7773453.1 AzlC family ABC transporter permease [Clostridium aminobutyricum]